MGYFISLLVFVAAIIVGVSVSSGPGNLAFLFDAPSLIIVLVPAFALSLSVTSWKTFVSCWKLVFSSNSDVAEEEMQEARAFLNAFGNTSLLLGIIGTIMGLIMMLADLSDPNSIGPNLSVAYITIFYGCLFKFLCFAAERRVSQKLLTSEQGE